MGYKLRRGLREVLGPDVTGLQRAVALEIADDANDRTRESAAPMDDLVRWTGAKDSGVVRNALKRLAAAGWEFRVPIGKGKDGRLLYAVPGHRMTYLVPPFEMPEGVAVAPSKEELGLPLNPKGGAPAPSEGAGAPPSPSPLTNSQTDRESHGYPFGGDNDFAACQPLIQAMTDAGITVSWQMRTEQWTDTVRVLQRAGVEAMVHSARLAVRNAKTPPRYAKYFLAAGWLGLPPRSTRTAPTNVTLPHCGDIDCDSESRTRSSYDPKGYRLVSPCPQCHPTRQGAAA